MMERSSSRPQVTRVLIPLAVAAVFGAAMYFLYDALKDIHYRDVLVRIRSYAPATLALAGAATVINYFILTFYDVLALRYAERKLPYPKVAFASFLSYVFSYNVGLSLFGSSALRLRLYPAWGIEAGTVAKIVAFCAATFWLGLATMGGGALLLAPPAAAVSWRYLGIVPVALVALYLVFSVRGGEGLHIRGIAIRLPSGRIAAAQVAVAALDWTFAALVLFLLMPRGIGPFPSFLALYAVAQLAGAASHVPGGVGVFESIMVASLSRTTPPEALLGALLAYRGIYYLAPLSVAIVAFVSREAWVARSKVAGAANAAARVFAPLTPAVLSAAVLLSGAVLLFSGAVPAVSERLEILDLFLPLPILELSHFSASLVGVALLVVADAVRRRIDAAYWAALALLAAGAVLSLLKGLDWEEATAMAVVAALLVPSRRVFVRRAALLSPSSVPWTFAVSGVVVAVSLWLALFANKHELYSSEQWWVFELSKNAPRSLRAGVAVAVAALAVGLRLLLAPSPHVRRETLEEDETDARRVIAASSVSIANLALLGDKFLRFGPARRSYLMYAVSGRTFVVMGDPIGDETEFSSLAWDFQEEASRQGARVVWYEVSALALPLLSELGYRFYKIGEEAVVDLTSFTLEGAKGKRLRPSRNKILREGFSFSMLSPEETRRRMPELRRISDEWLALKNAKEKGFSLGFFDENYLGNFPCAVVEKDGVIVAFSNLWPSGDGSELSVDLMRHNADAPGGTMEYLFTELLLWGAGQAYRRFHLGMAPLSGVEARESAPLWNKAVALIFRNGEGIYNFQGLRAFKEKFGPSWEPRYVATSGGATLPLVAADLALVVSRGKRGVREA